MKSRRTSVAALLLLAGGMANADTTVFVSRGEQGEPVFSDAHSPGAQSFNIATDETTATPVSAEERVRFMLEVADSLADARRQREADRARQRRERAANVQQAPVVEQEIVYSPLAYRPYHPYRPGYGKPRRGRDEGRQMEESPAAERRSQSFRFTPDL